MSGRRRSKILKLDQVFDLLLNDTTSSEDLDSDVDQSTNTISHTDRIPTNFNEGKKKIETSDESSDDDSDDVPLWKLAAKEKILEDSKSLAETKKDAKQVYSNTDSEDDDIPLAELVINSKALKPRDANILNVDNNEEIPNAYQGISKLPKESKFIKMKNKKTVSFLKGIYDFLESESFMVENNGFETENSTSSESESSDYFYSDFKENTDVNLVPDKKKFNKSVMQSPVIKMAVNNQGRYYMSFKNLKRKKDFLS